MSNRIILIVLILFLGLPSNAQNSINDYRYVIVPMQFDFLKGKDKYRTSTLARYLFKKEGFEVYFDEEKLPEDLFDNRCLALYADVKKVSKLFKNSIQIELNDCYGNSIFISKVGSTKIKEYKEAFPVAIREAFESIKALNYTYNTNSKVGTNKKQNNTSDTSNRSSIEALNAKKEVERLKQEVESLKKQSESEKLTAAVSKEKMLSKDKVVTNPTIGKQDKSNTIDNSLMAKANSNGFELVDASNRLKMILLKTAAPNVFTVKGKEAIVFKEGNKWYYSENNTKTELIIKF